MSQGWNMFSLIFVSLLLWREICGFQGGTYSKSDFWRSQPDGETSSFDAFQSSVSNAPINEVLQEEVGSSLIYKPLKIKSRFTNSLPSGAGGDSTLLEAKPHDQISQRSPLSDEEASITSKVHSFNRQSLYKGSSDTLQGSSTASFTPQGFSRRLVTSRGSRRRCIVRSGTPAASSSPSQGSIPVVGSMKPQNTRRFDSRYVTQSATSPQSVSSVSASAQGSLQNEVGSGFVGSPKYQVNRNDAEPNVPPFHEHNVRPISTMQRLPNTFVSHSGSSQGSSTQENTAYIGSYEPQDPSNGLAIDSGKLDQLGQQGSFSPTQEGSTVGSLELQDVNRYNQRTMVSSTQFAPPMDSKEATLQRSRSYTLIGMPDTASTPNAGSTKRLVTGRWFVPGSLFNSRESTHNAQSRSTAAQSLSPFRTGSQIVLGPQSNSNSPSDTSIGVDGWSSTVQGSQRLNIFKGSSGNYEESIIPFTSQGSSAHMLMAKQQRLNQVSNVPVLTQSNLKPSVTVPRLYTLTSSSGSQEGSSSSIFKQRSKSDVHLVKPLGTSRVAVGTLSYPNLASSSSQSVLSEKKSTHGSERWNQMSEVSNTQDLSSRLGLQKSTTLVESPSPVTVNRLDKWTINSNSPSSQSFSRFSTVHEPGLNSLMGSSGSKEEFSQGTTISVQSPNLQSNKDLFVHGHEQGLGEYILTNPSGSQAETYTSFKDSTTYRESSQPQEGRPFVVGAVSSLPSLSSSQNAPKLPFLQGSRRYTVKDPSAGTPKVRVTGSWFVPGSLYNLKVAPNHAPSLSTSLQGPRQSLISVPLAEKSSNPFVLPENLKFVGTPKPYSSSDQIIIGS